MKSKVWLEQCHTTIEKKTCMSCHVLIREHLVGKIFANRLLRNYKKYFFYKIDWQIQIYQQINVTVKNRVSYLH